VPLADPLNQPVEERVPLDTSTGAQLPAGAYYLRIRTPEGPRAGVADYAFGSGKTGITLVSAPGDEAIVE
jgi:hypothetical protein